MSNHVIVKPLSGFRDFGPKEQAQRLWLVEHSLSVYRRFGYFPIETPTIEREEILMGQYGDEGDSLRYRFTDNGGRQVGLRYDLTVPFARFVAARLPKDELRLPYRRSQVGPVFRGESASGSQGRYREFFQADFDIAGSNEPAADAEIVIVAETMLLELGIKDFEIRINSRPLLDGLLRHYGVDETERCRAALVVLDKMSKIGRESVARELRDKVGVNNPDDLLDRMGDQFDPKSLEILLAGDDSGLDGLKNLSRIVKLAKSAMSDPNRLVVDLSLARGLAYYTGFVIETVVAGAEKFGSVLSGGRYDGTIGTFLGRCIPAVGASLGVDRCLDVLSALSLLPDQVGLADVAIVSTSSCADEAFTFAAKLRTEGLSVALLPDEMKMGRMLNYAEAVARWAIILDEKSVEADHLIVRRLSDRTTFTVSLFQEAVNLVRD